MKRNYNITRANFSPIQILIFLSSSICGNLRHLWTKNNPVPGNPHRMPASPRVVLVYFCSPMRQTAHWHRAAFEAVYAKEIS
jgi:hypothetical protein